MSQISFWHRQSTTYLLFTRQQCQSFTPSGLTQFAAGGLFDCRHSGLSWQEKQHATCKTVGPWHCNTYCLVWRSSGWAIRPNVFLVISQRAVGIPSHQQSPERAKFFWGLYNIAKITDPSPWKILRSIHHLWWMRSWVTNNDSPCSALIGKERLAFSCVIPSPRAEA